MNKLHEIYKCEVCGNITYVVHPGGGTLTCCNQPMKHMEENTTDAVVEKHVPEIEELENGNIFVKIGAVEHPMTEEHHIEWIEVITESRSYMKYLKVGEKPEAVFHIEEPFIAVREYCNLHGLWKKIKTYNN